MSIRSSIRIKRWAAVAALLLSSLPLFAGADKKQELYDQATKAGGQGKVEEAARLFCEVARMDANFKDSKQMCTLMTQEAEREVKKSDERFNEGVKAFQDGNFDEAEQKFRNVRAGSRIDEAKQYLGRIPAARNAKASDDAERTRYEAGTSAYRANDFATAKSNLGQVTGRRAQEAQILLDNIKRYEEAMSAGESASGAKDWTKAISSYTQASAIKPDGPGDPRGKLNGAQSQASAAQAAAAAAAQQAQAAKQAADKPATVKEPAKVDVAKLLREATTAQSQGKYALAAGKYLAVLAADPANEVARRGLEFVSPKTGGSASVGSEADAMLARAIREFYQGFYDESEVHIKDYLRFNGSRTGLSNFYLGAIGVTKYYLAGARESDRKLIADAKTYFQLARGTAGFTPPDQNVISPKILKVYSGEAQ